MKLTQNQKVAIYGSALQGVIISAAQYHAIGLKSDKRYSDMAIEHANELIAALEEMPDEQDEGVDNASETDNDEFKSVWDLMPSRSNDSPEWSDWVTILSLGQEVKARYSFNVDEWQCEAGWVNNVTAWKPITHQ